jgi:hypothetical protein
MNLGDIVLEKDQYVAFYMVPVICCNCTRTEMMPWGCDALWCSKCDCITWVSEAMRFPFLN